MNFPRAVWQASEKPPQFFPNYLSRASLATRIPAGPPAEWRHSKIRSAVEDLFECAEAISAWLRGLQWRHRLDLRLGVWALYEVGRLNSDQWLEVPVEKIYGIVAAHPHLEALSISHEIRQWSQGEYHTDPSQEQAHDEDHPERANINYLRVVMPGVNIDLQMEDTRPLLQHLTHFEVVAQSLLTNDQATDIVYRMADHRASTSTTIRVVAF
ncbi:hypothetical protein V8E36_002352 [Tilletia maclaganii]